MSSYEELSRDGVRVVGVRSELTPYLQPEKHAEQLFPGQAMFDAQPEANELIGIWANFFEEMKERALGQVDLSVEEVFQRKDDKLASFSKRYEWLDMERWNFAALLAADWLLKHAGPERPTVGYIVRGEDV